MSSTAENTSENSNSLEKFANRFNSPSYKGIDFDCEFIVGTEKIVIKGHKFVFAVSSEVFQAMFYGDLKEEKAVIVEDLHADGFECLKQFIYTGQVNFRSAMQALLTFVAARKYLIDELSEASTKFVLECMRPADVLQIYECCKMFKTPQFEDKCCELIQEATDQVVASEYFTTVQLETIELILKSSPLNLQSELDVFDLLERWALAEASRRAMTVERIATDFNSLKKHICFLTMNGNQFITRVVESPLLTQQEKLVIGVNLIELNAKPMPESISTKSQLRHFIGQTCTIKHHTFVFELDSYKDQSTECNANFCTFTLPFYIIKIDDYVCLRMRPRSLIDSLEMLVCSIETKLRVLATNSCNDLFIKKDCDFIGKKFDLRSDQKSKACTIAAIPLSKINKPRFLRGANTVHIEGTFEIKKLE
ncbi:BTB/POZ domain-containing protein 6 [Nilaparvata lugens]|uniref:BTB/POZ domain-containing protein 6 n=1 Tax=Nilaparvata lugens TaxID=108931 RepID=UPI00193D9334|nr:BTB/POZ domain-containing protein 6 [Nilaparvata lugens]